MGHSKLVRTDRIKHFLLALLVLFCFLSLSLRANQKKDQEKNKVKLLVEVDKVQPQRKGQICLSVFSLHRGFPGNWKKASHNFCQKVLLNQKKILFEIPAKGLLKKSIAISVLHDQNKNYQQDYFLFRPKEGFGFSNNAFHKREAKIPSFSEAQIKLNSLQKKQVKINLVYL